MKDGSIYRTRYLMPYKQSGGCTLTLFILTLRILNIKIKIALEAVLAEYCNLFATCVQNTTELYTKTNVNCYKLLKVKLLQITLG